MPVVPMNPGSAQGTGLQMPSETNLLMALAEMKKQGSFDQGDRTPQSKNPARLQKGPLKVIK